MRHTILLAVFAIACAKSTPQKTIAEPHEEPHGDHHEGMDPLVTEFHDVLAPVWHAELPDAEYAKQACGKSAEMQAIAVKIAAAPVPQGGEQGGWIKHGGLLQAETEALAQMCSNESGADWSTNVREQLGDVHERFHLVMLASKPAAE